MLPVDATALPARWREGVGLGEVINVGVIVPISDFRLRPVRCVRQESELNAGGVADWRPATGGT